MSISRMKWSKYKSQINLRKADKRKEKNMENFNAKQSNEI